MNKRMTGYGRRWQAWRALMPVATVVANAAVAIGGRVAIRAKATTAARGARIAPLMLGLAVVLGGCGVGRTTPQAQLFDLGPAPDAASSASAGFASSSASASSRSIPGATARREAVAVTFSASQMLTDTGVIWRIGDSASPNSYATYRWAAPPSQLVRQRVIDSLSVAGPVVQDGVDPRAPLLQVTLTRFEQVYAPDGKSSTGQVALQAVLIRDHSVVDSVQLARGAPAPTLDAQGGVLALRAATDAASADLTAWVEKRLSTSAISPTSPTPSVAASTDPLPGHRQQR